MRASSDYYDTKIIQEVQVGMGQPLAFLSYTRRDDEFFGGAISALRRTLELGVQVVTGDRDFEIFQDIEGIELGQQWKNRLSEAIADAF